MLENFIFKKSLPKIFVRKLIGVNTKKYTADEKRELIDAHYLLMIKTAKRGLDLLYYKVDNDNK